MPLMVHVVEGSRPSHRMYIPAQTAWGANATVAWAKTTVAPATAKPRRPPCEPRHLRYSGQGNNEDKCRPSAIGGEDLPLLSTSGRLWRFHRSPIVPGAVAGRNHASALGTGNRSEGSA